MKRITSALLGLCLLGHSLAFAVDIKTVDGPGGWTRDGSVVSVQNPGTDIVVFGDFSSTAGGIGDMSTGTYDPTGIEGDAFLLDNHFGNISTSNIPNWPDAVIGVSLDTGVESHIPGDDTSCKITRNSGDITKFDMAACTVHIQGRHYEIDAIVAGDPEFSISGNHKWIIATFSGSTGVIVKQDATPTRTQKRTRLTLARIQATEGQTGSGSDISDVGILDKRYLTSEDGARNEDYLSRVFGGLFVTGGLITENATPNELDISAGEMYNGVRAQQIWGSFSNISGLRVFHSSSALVSEEVTFVIDQVNWDDGADLVPMTNNNYHCGHSLFMAPRGTQDAGIDRLRLIWVHCASEHSDLQGAIDAGIDYGPFVSKAVSGLVPLAQVLVKKNTGIVDIIDYRDRIGAAGGSITMGSITLQGAYNNSSPGASEIILSTAQDGFTISDNATPVGDLFKLNNFANNTSFFAVSPSGTRVFGNLSVGTINGESVSIPDPSLNGFRLTLSTGVPVTTADVVGATTIYATPYNGNLISLYDGTNWNTRGPPEFSLALGTLISGRPYDIFCYDDSGTPTLEFLAWTDDTTRATAITYQDGVKVKSGDATRRYLGVFYTTSTTTTESSETSRYLQNENNQVPLKLYRVETTTQWTYNGAFRQFNNNTANQVNFVSGSVETLVTVQLHCRRWNSQAGVTTVSAIGLDSTSTPIDGTSSRSYFDSTGANYSMTSQAWYIGYLGVGKHYFSLLEFSNAGGTTTWVGAQSPLAGILMG